MNNDFDENGVLGHEYTITLADGDTKTVNVGCEDDWGNIQQCVPDDCDDWETSVGWGNDEDGHIKIVDVVDEETGEHIEPLKWAKDRVWCYVDYFSC